MSQFSQVKRETLQVAAERAVLVAVHLPDDWVDPDDPFQELRSLTQTAGADVVGELIQKRQKPDGRTYLGKGKVDELAGLVKLTGATLVIFDAELAPSQIAAIEEETRCKVIDRSELILDIFAGRATTHAAKLQVEIAQLEYTYPRLRAMWDHLGQVTGGAPVGIGTRGPGEQQLEIDRRLVKVRKAQLKRELEEIESRKAREVESRNLDHFTVGLVGYTNAGKSTLFNRLTSGGAYADDRLFSTLSTRVEKWNLGGGNVVMLSDTVGFIRDLPHHLVASFRSTLEETRFARLILMVVDAADPRAAAQLEVVQSTLDAIGAMSQPRLVVLNKADAPRAAELLPSLQATHPGAISISARIGTGIDTLRDFVRSQMLGDLREVEIDIPLAHGRAVDYVEKRGEVMERRYADQHVTLRARIGRTHLSHLLSFGSPVRVNGEDGMTALRALWPHASAESSNQSATG